MKIHNFSAGPSILPQEVLQKASEAVLNFNSSGLSLIEISHRTPSFVSIINEARDLALELSGLNNKGYTALFLQGGASLEFVRVAYNLLSVNGKAGYINTGTWSNNAIHEASFFGEIIEIASSRSNAYKSLPKDIQTPSNLDYVHITSNNTIYGTQFNTFPKCSVPLVCDMSSDIFSREIDFSQFDLIYAGAQKNVGTAGANLILVKNDVLNRTNRSIPNIMNYSKHIEKDSLYNTPSVFAIYTCYLTLKWLKNLGGVKAIEKVNIAKATLLYSELDRNSLFYNDVAKEDRSKMNVPFYLFDDQLTQKFDLFCDKNGISGLKGHRTVGGYRASIYNALPFESVIKLVEVLQNFEKQII